MTDCMYCANMAYCSLMYCIRPTSVIYKLRYSIIFELDHCLNQQSMVKINHALM